MNTGINIEAIRKFIDACGGPPKELSVARNDLVAIINKINENSITFWNKDLDNIDEILLSQLILSMSYFIFDNGVHDQGISQDDILKVLDGLWENRCRNEADEENYIDQLINILQPMLLKIPRDSSFRSNKKNGSRSIGLNPKLGFSMKEDKLRSQWEQNYGKKSIGLFYFTLYKLKRSQVSSNLWWIIPGILNLLDDTTNLRNIKLRAVDLFYQLLESFIEGDKQNGNQWISLKQAGLFDLFEPILRNMLYFTPPSYSMDDTLLVWEKTYKTLFLLNKLQNESTPGDYYRYLQTITNEIILQHSIPHCGLKYEPLLSDSLSRLSMILKDELKEHSVILMQRIMYTLGEIIIKDPFFTLYDKCILQTLDLLRTLITVCPEERLPSHKYDLLGLVLILLKKCEVEGKLTSEVLSKSQETVAGMAERDCDFQEDQTALAKEPGYKDIVIKLFNYRT